MLLPELVLHIKLVSPTVNTISVGNIIADSNTSLGGKISILTNFLLTLILLTGMILPMDDTRLVTNTNTVGIHSVGKTSFTKRADVDIIKRDGITNG